MHDASTIFSYGISYCQCPQNAMMIDSANIVIITKFAVILTLLTIDYVRH